MTRRSVASLILLTIVTFGIYSIVWFVKTKREMNERGADIPSAWLMIIPIVSIWWMWSWSGGVEKVTNGKTTQVIAFILVFLLGIIGMAIIQASFNKDTPEGVIPQARIA